MRFLDSTILAYAFYQNEFQVKCQKTIQEGGIINTVNLIEAFNIIEHETDRETAVFFIRGLLKANLEIVNVDVNVIFEALKRAPWFPQLKFIDLVHYTVASLKNCEAIITYDRDFDNLEIAREEP